MAVDHCPRSLLEVCSAEGVAATKHALLLTLLDNHEGRTVEMVRECIPIYNTNRCSCVFALTVGRIVMVVGRAVVSPGGGCSSALAERRVVRD